MLPPASLCQSWMINFEGSGGPKTSVVQSIPDEVSHGGSPQGDCSPQMLPQKPGPPQIPLPIPFGFQSKPPNGKPPKLNANGQSPKAYIPFGSVNVSGLLPT